MSFEKDFDFVVEKVYHYLPDVFPLEWDARVALTTFRRVHGDNAIKAMKGFIHYAESKNMPKLSIKVALSHDLGGRNDKKMLPRTDAYLEYAEGNLSGKE